MQIVYSTEMVANLAGREFRNPRHFLAPVEGATKVYIAGDWPNVVRAYEKAGVSVAPIEEMRALPKAKPAKAAKHRRPGTTALANAEPTPPEQPQQ
jgi:hypothetical protein